MSTILTVRGRLPEHRYTQPELTELFASLCLPDAAMRPLAQRLHRGARVETRHLALPIAEYYRLDGFTAANDAYVRVAVELGSQVLLDALDAAGLRVEDVDVVVSASTTGLAVPSLESRIAARVGLRSDVKRVPLVGLGCLAGAAGIARVQDFLRGSPDAVAVLVSIELCSLTVQRDDPSATNMVASGLFGDGAAAVVMVGAQHARAADGPQVLDTRSHLYPDTDRAMGWDIGAGGFKIVLGAEVPDLVREFLAVDVEKFLGEHSLQIPDVARWVCHPGGPKVIEAIQDSLGLTEHDLWLTWESLRRVGNLSSASVLHVLSDTLDQRPASPGDRGVLMAMGPGFASELVLLQW